MSDPSLRPARRRRGGRRRRSAARVSEAWPGQGLNAAERELLASFCAPGAALLSLGSATQALAASRLGYRVSALDAEGGEAAGEAGVPEIEWLAPDPSLLSGAAGRFDGALLQSQLLDPLLAREARIGLLRDTARAVRRGGHVLVSVRRGLRRTAWRRWLWDVAERRAATRPGWQSLERVPSAAPEGARRAATLLREAGEAGLRLVAERPWPEPPPGALGAIARRGAACWHLAFEVV